MRDRVGESEERGKPAKTHIDKGVGMEEKGGAGEEVSSEKQKGVDMKLPVRADNKVSAGQPGKSKDELDASRRAERERFKMLYKNDLKFQKKPQTNILKSSRYLTLQK